MACNELLCCAWLLVYNYITLCDVCICRSSSSISTSISTASWLSRRASAPAAAAAAVAGDARETLLEQGTTLRFMLQLLRHRCDDHGTKIGILLI